MENGKRSVWFLKHCQLIYTYHIEFRSDLSQTHLHKHTSKSFEHPISLMDCEDWYAPLCGHGMCLRFGN